MDEPANRSPFQTLRARAELRNSPFEERASVPDEILSEADSAPETPSAPSRRRKQQTTTNEFTGSLVPAQFKLPADLVQSLKLHAIDTGENMSEIVLRCLTSADVLTKAWISTRKAG